MKTGKIFSILLIVGMMAFTFHCTNEDDAIVYKLSDVSSRISGFSSEVTGAGAALTVNGTGLTGVVRICMQNVCIPSKLFTTVSESSIVFNVPLSVPLGESPVLFVFGGSERAFSKINVVALPAISSFFPFSASQGETVTILGTNLQIVNDVKIGSVSSTITSQAGNMIRFTVPAGATTSRITLVSPPGSATSATDLISCEAGASTADCPAGINMNAGFELGADDNFTNWNKFNGGTKILATTNIEGNEVYRGSRALKVLRDGTITPGDQWRIQLASDFVPVTEGTSYTVFAWVRASVAGATFRFSNQDAAQYGGDTAIPITWTRISWTFTANAAQKRIVLDLNGTPTTTFFIDDVKLVQN